MTQAVAAHFKRGLGDVVFARLEQFRRASAALNGGPKRLKIGIATPLFSDIIQGSLRLATAAGKNGLKSAFA